jgi:DNA-binding transcriptional LysR family regulator
VHSCNANDQKCSWITMRLPDLEIDLLRAFVAVADSGGFTPAAELVGRTQSAVSQKVKRLEELTGKRLFERTSRSLALTKDGELLLGHARRILSLNDEAVRELRAPPVRGLLRLGVAEDSIPHQLPRLLARFARGHPGVRLDLTTGMSCELVRKLEAGALDLALANRDGMARRGRLIWSEPLAWIAAAADFALDPDAPVPLVALAPPCTYRQTATEALERAGRSWRVACTSGSVMGLQAAVAAGLGVAVLGRSFVRDGLMLLGPRAGLPPLPATEVALLGEETAQVPLARPLVAFLVEELGGVNRGAA